MNSATPAQVTQLDLILSELRTQNSRYVSTISQLENLGHKLRNTDYPKVTEPQTARQSEGMLDEVEAQVILMCNHNGRFEELVEKLSKLI